MINLLSPSHKKEIKSGRINVLLSRYITLLASALILLIILVGGTYVVLRNSQVTAQQRLDDTNEKVAKYSATKNAANKFRSDLATAKTILDKEVAYSKLIYKIADAVPSGVILDSLELDSKTLGSQADLSAQAKSYDAAIRLKSAFESNTKLFSDVHFVSVTGNSSGKYPVKVSLSVIINKGTL